MYLVYSLGWYSSYLKTRKLHEFFFSCGRFKFLWSRCWSTSYTYFTYYNIIILIRIKFVYLLNWSTLVTMLQFFTGVNAALTLKCVINTLKINNHWSQVPVHTLYKQILIHCDCYLNCKLSSGTSKKAYASMGSIGPKI